VRPRQSVYAIASALHAERAPAMQRSTQASVYAPQLASRAHTVLHASSIDVVGAREVDDSVAPDGDGGARTDGGVADADA
jgi:hypothetical protein